MNNNAFDNIQELLRTRADYQARLKLLPYDGSVEIKEQGDRKYLYVRKREGGRYISQYAGIYSDDLYRVLLSSCREAKELKRSIRHIEKELSELGFEEKELPARVVLNLEFARANMKSNIYDQAVLEGVATSFPQTEDIIENGKVNGVTATDVQKILNLKHAWEFIIDRDVIQCPSDYYLLCNVAKLVNEGFYAEGGRIRGVPVTIGGTSYIPPLPVEYEVRDRIKEIAEGADPTDTAIELCLYCMKTQIYNDGNKRAAVIFANHYLISHGGGFIVIPESRVPEFKKLLVAYYEGRGEEEIKNFMKEYCVRNF